MEFANKRLRCNSCGMSISAPTGAQAIQCPLCHTMNQIQSNDPLSQVHGRFKHLLNAASSKINKVVSGVNYYGSGTSGFGHQPLHPSPVPSLAPFSAHGRKRAVLCGVSYYGQQHRLNGTVNDVQCMRYFLVHRLGFPIDAVIVLSEEESDPFRIPTKNNIRNALRWLVQGCQFGDSLIFHYSGHGSQQLDYNRDEVDGYDEVLWPMDHQMMGTILDDEINSTIVRPLPPGTKLHAIIDACHSGTVLDLPFVCRMSRNGYYEWEDHGRFSAIYKGTKGGFAVSFSACDDHQVTVDTTALTGTATGIMTYSFIEAAQHEPGMTYGHLLNAMRRTIRNSKTGLLPNGLATSLFKKVLHPTSQQEPQLCSSEWFDIYTRPFAP